MESLASARAIIWPPLRHFLNLARFAIVMAALLIVLGQFVGLYRVEQASMFPEFQPGDYLVIDRTASTSLTRGQVVVIRAPAGLGQGPTALLKRVIGLPGETVSFRNGYVRINGRQLEEMWLPSNVVTEGPSVPITVPVGSVYLLGDNRPVSLDSRFFGPVTIREVVGRIEMRIWPVASADQP